MVNVELLRELEILALEWEQREGSDEGMNAYWFCVTNLRVTIASYLEPETKVRYVYANQWRTGTLLTRPNKSNPCWQVRRSGYGGWIDQVQQNVDIMRIYVETGKGDKG